VAADSDNGLTASVLLLIVLRIPSTISPLDGNRPAAYIDLLQCTNVASIQCYAGWDRGEGRGVPIWMQEERYHLMILELNELQMYLSTICSVKLAIKMGEFLQCTHSRWFLIANNT
jgi:hypothetical protein